MHNLAAKKGGLRARSRSLKKREGVRYHAGRALALHLDALRLALRGRGKRVRKEAGNASEKKQETSGREATLWLTGPETLGG
eukprot:2601118-Rhodomonas_salina.1